jgi:hypothetical protein
MSSDDDVGLLGSVQKSSNQYEWQKKKTISSRLYAEGKREQNPNDKNKGRRAYQPDLLLPTGLKNDCFVMWLSQGAKGEEY